MSDLFTKGSQRRCLRCGGSGVPPGLVGHIRCPRFDVFDDFKAAWQMSGGGTDLLTSPAETPETKRESIKSLLQGVGMALGDRDAFRDLMDTLDVALGAASGALTQAELEEIGALDLGDALEGD